MQVIGRWAGIGATSTGSRTITVPTTTPVGSYRLLACADDTLKIDESDEANNTATVENLC